MQSNFCQLRLWSGISNFIFNALQNPTGNFHPAESCRTLRHRMKCSHIAHWQPFGPWLSIFLISAFNSVIKSGSYKKYRQKLGPGELFTSEKPNFHLAGAVDTVFTVLAKSFHRSHRKQTTFMQFSKLLPEVIKMFAGQIEAERFSTQLHSLMKLKFK